MKIVHSFSNFNADQETIVTIGTFDGVHFGHQQILKKVVLEAKKLQKKSLVLTFFPHPKRVLQKDLKIELINTIEEKAALLEETGLDYLVIQPFDKDFSRLSALEFVRNVLVNQLKTHKLIIGYDHYFGKNREGNTEQLREYSKVYDFLVEEIPAQDIDNVSVSSTKIRNALASGKLKKANDYLGYPFMLSGEVVNGKQLGGEIGFPTANIHIKEAYKLVPKTGVYAVKSTINKQVIFGMMNIGNRPTVGGEHQTIEVHFFDFNQDLYRQKLTIELLYFLRSEQKFDNIDSLISQLKKDEKNARSFLKSNR